MGYTPVFLNALARGDLCEYFEELYILENIFNGLHFYRTLYMPISITLA